MYSTDLLPNLPGAQADNTEDIGNISLPLHSSWFDFNYINDIERIALPEFFNKDCDDNEYMKNRNYIIQTYRMNPSIYFSFTMCRRFVVGDVASLLRLHSFLEQWSLINSEAQWPKGKRRPLPSPIEEHVKISIPSIIKDSLNGGAELSSHTLALNASNPLKKIKNKTIKCSVCSKNPLELYYCASTLLSEEEGKTRGLFVSSTTPYIPSSTQRSIKTIDPIPQNPCKPELIICCPPCFSHSKWTSITKTFKIEDFKFVNLSLINEKRRMEWTEDEVEELMRQVDIENNSSSINWDRIATTIGRAKEDCIAKFLKIPLEIDSIMSSSSYSSSSASSPPPPFETLSNPLLATLSFLVSSLPPKVAAAASAAALSELDRCDGGNGGSTKIASRQLAQVAAVAMSAVQVKSSEYVVEEEAKIEHLRLKLLECQMKKLSLKMKMLEDIEKQAELDRKDLEHQRLQLFYERFNLRRQMGGGVGGVGEGGEGGISGDNNCNV